ncbi:MAG: hypothetical protein M1151_05520 [Candidatus Thermoplasmatota archaeon]|nr:hypothetical protein [Candidatus Thermoplasmatota archaeon]MCL5786106.1 hypothetical protein [Candidatus Thermoplasmatota archaeon]
MKDGFGFLRRHRTLMVMTFASMALNFFSFYLLYIVVYTLNILHQGSLIFGILVGSSSLG